MPKKTAARPRATNVAPDSAAVLLALLEQKWVLRVLWELRGDGLTFRPLRAACGGPSPAILNERLQALREAGFVEPSEEGYYLTPLGEELVERVAPIVAWAPRWAKDRASLRAWRESVHYRSPRT